MTQEQIKAYRLKNLGIIQEDNASEKAYKIKTCSCCDKKIFFFRNMCDECLNKLLAPILKQH